MESNADRLLSLSTVSTFLRRCFFSVLSFGPMPSHVGFIMDGNRRYMKIKKLGSGSGHRAGSLALTSTLQYCYELGIKYVTIYAFSIDNFKRKPEEVEDVMNLILEKITELSEKGSIVDKYDLRINFWGNLVLLKDHIQSSAQKVMAQTARNKGPVLSICVAYTSAHEIVHAIEKSCNERLNNEKLVNLNEHCEDVISVGEIEKNLFTADCPDPEIIIRTSGETRLSNFLIWQTSFSLLQNPRVLWPEFSLRHLVWSILEYQRAFPYLEKARKVA